MARSLATRAGAIVAAVLAAAAAPASAQFEAGSDEPIEITADAMEWRHEEQIAIARGNADAIQGKYHLHADVLIAHVVDVESGREIQRIDATGNVVLTTPDETVVGDFGTYDAVERIAELTDNVVLTQGENVIRGGVLVMDLDSGRSTLLPGVQATDDGLGPPPGRVRAVLAPSKDAGGLTGADGRQLQGDSDEPIEITADAMDWLRLEQVAMARGNADAIQGSYHLHAAVLSAYIAEDAAGERRVERIDANGNVVLTTPEESARGDAGTYHVDTQIAVLTGDVVLAQADNVIRGGRLVMNLATGQNRLEAGTRVAGDDDGDGDGDGRVRAILAPSDQPNEAEE